VVGVFLVFATGCANKSAYVCTSTDQCLRDDVQGVCEPQGFCSFADPSCPSGHKFEPNAGNGLGGTCTMVDAAVAACGAVGEACCASGSACGGNGFCSNGTCQECVTAIAPGRHASCLLKYDHTVWCAGENQVGQLGFGQVGSPMPTWMQVRDSTSATIGDATALAAGNELACAVRTGGSVWCWGGMVSSPAAVEVQKTNGMPLTGIVEIGGGYGHVCGRDNLGGVWCWGTGSNGQLGDGTTTGRSQAAPVLDAPMGVATTGVLALSVGGGHSCIRKANNAIWCWGNNTSGQLGDGSLMDRPNPVMIGTGTSFGTGPRTSCIVHLDGTTWCSGEAWHNRIGNGVSTYDAPAPSTYPMPTEVLVAPGGAPFTGVSSVALGGVSCALKQDKTLACWGDDPYGETGTGAGTSVPAPVLTLDQQPLTDVDWAVAKFAHVCAHRTDGELLCWGRNLEGALGDGSFANRGLATPLRFTCP
jgi:alpha-tubulin suppressor-like RCC1 family protein